MAELFVFNIARTILEKISTPIFDELSLAWGVKDDLQRLKNTMSYVYAVLLDAQQKQETNHQLRDWLGKLNETLYDAEIVLDEFEFDALRRKVFDQNIASKVKNFFSPKNQVAFRFKMAHKIKKIREEFDDVAADRNKFNLIERYEEKDFIRREMTHSFVRPEDVIGRDKDIEDVVTFLIEKNGHENISVLPLVGLGGMGKTTLSKIVFNEKRVCGNFNLKMWICVSEDFDLQLIIRNILKSLGFENCDNLELEQLQNRLREKLDDRKYFLILDDVWNENRAKWIELKNLLMGGAKGSKIIVTTRSKLVASIVSTNGCSKEIEGLSHEESLSLFLKWSFKSVQDSGKHPKLVEIAEEIVKKCKGVPLALITLGNILYLKTEIRDWLQVRDNDIWKIEQKDGDILPALKVTYHHLPSNLRRCFSFCSLFPKDDELRSDTLISIWGANGLLKNSNDNEDAEDVGLKYIEQLRSVGFFQEFQERRFSLCFKMHDLVHDLALLVAEHGIVCMNSQQVQHNRITRKVRHVSFPFNYLVRNEFPSWLYEQKDVRTIHLLNRLSEPEIEKCISKFKRLYFLDIRETYLTVLPKSIGSLKHLRHLDLSFNGVITSLPDSICELVGLEVLYFHGCWGIKKIPKGLGKLTRLGHLGLSTNEEFLPEDEFRNLTSLETLIISNCPNIEILFSDNVMLRLSSLRKLSIESCPRLECLPTKGLRQLTRLETLSLYACDNLQLNNSDNDFDCGNELLSLRVLELFQLPKLVDFPVWLIQAAKNLKNMEISYCHNLTNIALERMVENSKSLQKLEIYTCRGITSLPDGMQSLTELNEIRIRYCQKEIGEDWNAKSLPVGMQSRCPGSPLNEICTEFVRRCQREIGEDWEKISHVKNIYLDDKKI